MKTIHLHIGYEKTGTTSIQTYCTTHREQLSELGFLYPVSGHFNVAHSGLVDSILAETKNKHLEFLPESSYFNMSVWEDLSKEVENFGGDNVIISSEHFSSRLNAAGIKILNEKLAAIGEIRIHLYLRRQDSLAESYYSTLIRSGNDVTLQELVKRVKSKGRYFDYPLIIAPWEEIFGQEAVSLRLFDSISTKAGIVNDFLGLGLGITTLPSEHTAIRANASFNPLTLLIGASLNAEMKEETFFTKSEIIRNLNQAIAQIKEFDSLKNAPLLSPKIRTEIAKTYETENSTLLNKYSVGRSFSEPKAKSIYKELHSFDLQRALKLVLIKSLQKK